MHPCLPLPKIKTKMKNQQKSTTLVHHSLNFELSITNHERHTESWLGAHLTNKRSCESFIKKIERLWSRYDIFLFFHFFNPDLTVRIAQKFINDPISHPSFWCTRGQKSKNIEMMEKTIYISYDEVRRDIKHQNRIAHDRIFLCVGCPLSLSERLTDDGTCECLNWTRKSQNWALCACNIHTI